MRPPTSRRGAAGNLSVYGLALDRGSGQWLPSEVCEKFPVVTRLTVSSRRGFLRRKRLSFDVFGTCWHRQRGIAAAIALTIFGLRPTHLKNNHTAMRIIRYSYPNARRSALAPAFSRAPWSGLETEIDQLFETALGDFANQTSATRFPVDLYQDKDHTYVRAELPGVNRDDINVEVVDGYLTITANRKSAKSGSEQNTESFSLSRSLELPDEVQTEQISAAYENGVLTVTLPKREEAKPRKISVNVK